MAKTKLLANKIGVDRLTWEITDHPAGAASEKYRIGSPAWKRIFYQIWDSSQIGSALKSTRYSARIKVGKKRLIGSSNQKIILDVTVKNRGGATWITKAFSGRRWVRLGAQLHDAEKKLLELNFARAFLPRPLAGGDKAIVKLELPVVSRSGDYWLKFDMVSEGADWFEKGGSPVLWLPFKVSE
jgi:hypothetical protein